MKLGQVARFKKPHTLINIVGEKAVIVPGDKAIVTNQGYKIKIGNAENLILPFTEDEKRRLRGYDTKNISEEIYYELNRDLSLEKYLDEYDIDKFIETVEYVLMEILL